MGDPKPPLMLRDSFCLMLAEGALDLLQERTPALKAAIEELYPEPPDYEPNEYHDLACALADQFKSDYLLAVKPDPDAPTPAEKVTKIR